MIDEIFFIILLVFNHIFRHTYQFVIVLPLYVNNVVVVRVAKAFEQIWSVST